MKKSILTIIVILICTIGISQSYNLTLNITNIEKIKGDMSIALFDNGDKFPGRSNCYFGINLPVTLNELTYVFKDIPRGTYAIAIYHDIDKNGKMNTNWIGIPNEPYGFSNDAMGKMGPPKFEDASFEVTSDLEVSISLNN